MEKLVDKLSAYDIVNSLLPGMLICATLDEYMGIHVFDHNWCFSAIVCYIAGLFASRLGSFCVEPLFVNLKWITPEPYPKYVKAEQKDENVRLHMAIANMYRSLIVGFLICAAIIILSLTGIDFAAPLFVEIALALSVALFAVAYSKQYGYVAKRVRANTETEEGKTDNSI